MIEDSFTFVSEENNQSSWTATSVVSNMTFAQLAKGLEGEKTNHGYGMILHFLRNFKNKFALLEDEER